MTTTACYQQTTQTTQTIFSWEVQVRDIKVSWSNIFPAYDSPNNGIQGLLQVKTFCISWKMADEVIPFWSFMKLPKMKLSCLVGFGMALSWACHTTLATRSPETAAIYPHHFPALRGIEITCGIISQREMRLMRHDARKPRKDWILWFFLQGILVVWKKLAIFHVLQAKCFRTKTSIIT